jgi:hypothetical protein
MSRAITQNANPFGAVLYGNTNLTATADTNVRGGSTTVYQFTVDNSANGAATYLVAYNNAAPTVATTPPDMIFLVAANSKKTFTLDFLGVPFSTALSLACVTTPMGNTSPSSAVAVYALIA